MTRMLPLVLSLGLLQGGQSPAVQVSQKTAEIRGRVSDEETGAPIARAVVQLYFVDRTGADTISAPTDEEGRYQFTLLTGGDYMLIARAPEFGSSYVMVSAGANTGSLKRIELRKGERRTDVDFTLAKGFAITVHVVDEWREPLAGVSASVSRAADGRVVTAPNLPQRTDDRGRVRIYGLPADSYVVCAEPSAYAFLGNDHPAGEELVRTCAPSALTPAEAEPIQLGRSDAEAEIRVRRGR
ncbi:MAG TPA: carboxypeptidase-like regulatory domain-containing protein, partial [Vicinamibacterales bacterium]